MTLARTPLAALLTIVLTARTPAADPVKNADLQYIPSDSNVLIVLRVDKVLASDSVKKLRKEIPTIDKGLDSSFRKELGFEISNVERVIVGIQAKGGVVVGVLHLKNGIKAETVVKAVSAPRADGGKGTNYKEEKVGSLTMYVPARKFTEAFCLVNDRIMIYGPVEDLRPVLARNQKADLSVGLQAALKASDPAALLTIVGDLNAVIAAERPLMVLGGDFKLITASVSGFSFTINDFGADVVFRGVALCKDAKAAAEMKTQVEAMRKGMLELLKAAPPGAVSKGLPELLGTAKIETKGNVVEATLRVKVDNMVAMIKTLINPNIQPPSEKQPPVEKKP